MTWAYRNLAACRIFIAASSIGVMWPSPTALAQFLTPGEQYKPLRAKLTIPQVPRDEVICFCLYTTHRGVLKLSAQLYPLLDGESRTVTLQIETDSGWRTVGDSPADEEGWLATFRVENWDDTRAWNYRVIHDGGSDYRGIIRRNPRDSDEIVVANLSCNSSTDRNPRPDIIANLTAHDPDLLFFGGDQVYDHKHHLAAWLLFGRQFGDIIKDRPTVTIPDDHDVGHPNLWGAGGKRALDPAGADGGYFMPVAYVNMVQRAQTAHLPDPFDPTPILRGITVYYTSLNVGGIDFAIIEDRKWKSGPAGLVQYNGPRPDHITDPEFDPAIVDIPEAELLGRRQLAFLHHWAQDWHGAEMKAILSQTVFAGAAHLHGRNRDRLVADLDSNGWPQSGRDAALGEIRKAFAFMMAGDQHLATVIHHGINEFEDAGVSFVSPSIWNLYGRWWLPPEEPVRHSRGGANPSGPLPFTGRFRDGFNNKLTMLAYVNPTAENHQGTGYGIARFRKSTRTITMECWPRFQDVTAPGASQYPGWPVTIHQQDNYARHPAAWLPELLFENAENPVIQIIDEANNEIVYTLRIRGNRFRPKVFRRGTYTVRIQNDDRHVTLNQIPSMPEASRETISHTFR